MRKADYALLASIIQTHADMADGSGKHDIAQAVRNVGDSFAIAASVDPAAFRLACGIKPAPSKYERAARAAGFEMRENRVVNVGFYCAPVGGRDDAPTTCPTEAGAWVACCILHDLKT